ncbi:hypothetical protein BBROOKSOX_922 [Bathymodiolus brooksi thiotrophic gill symbiont]|nr:hypothetical protein BBROOKSOX_922 [Bathymodiolus brooksi thiotrophic gill symbiont]
MNIFRLNSNIAKGINSIGIVILLLTFYLIKIPLVFFVKKRLPE